MIVLILINLDSANAKDEIYGNLVVSQVTSIYDGDTFRADIKGLHPLIGSRIGIRVAGIDTPEIRGKCPLEKKLAREAKQFTVAMLRNAKYVELHNVRRGKYFRIVADVMIDGKSLSSSLIKAGHGVPYNGETKARDWCI